MSSDRTEKPTAKRLRDARKKGQVARSRDLAQAASLLAAVLALGWMGGPFLDKVLLVLRAGFERSGDWAVRPISVGDVAALADEGVITVATIVAPLALTAVVASVAVHIGQGGFVIASDALQLNWGRLNPASGVKRFGLKMGGTETLRMVLAVALIGWLGYGVLSAHVGDAYTLAQVAPADAAGVMWTRAITLVKQTGFGLLLLGGVDYLVERQKLMANLRMTRQEVKDEAKQNEGNPQVKGRIRTVQRAMARRRMMAAAKKATVVITNPTHYAVALEYRRASMAAPRVVAKGQGLVAQRIKKIARAHGIPTVENVTLARALYASAEIGDIIPASLFEAVAEVLAYLVRLRQLVL